MSRCKAGTSGSRRCRCPTPSRCASSACTPTRCTRRPWRPSRCRARRPAGSAANPCATRRCWTGHRSSCGRSSATRWSAQRDRGQCRPRDLDGLADLGRCPMWTLVELAVRALANEDRDHDIGPRSEEHTSELQSRPHLVCRLLLEKKKKKQKDSTNKQKKKNKTKIK